MDLYERLQEACREKDTTLTTVLRKIGLATGNTGNWKNGKVPRVDAIIGIAEYLNMSIDELIYGRERAEYMRGLLYPGDIEWLQIIHHIPEDKQEICKDFLKTHMVEPEKFKTKIAK